MGVFDDIREKTAPDPKVAEKAKQKFKASVIPSNLDSQEGYIWVNMLIKYDTHGGAEIIRSFTKPAEMSKIKHLIKKKPKKQSIKIDTEVNDEKGVLF